MAAQIIPVASACVFLGVVAFRRAAAGHVSGKNSCEYSSMLQLRSEACKENPQDEKELREVLRHVSTGSWSGPVSEAWAAYQADVFRGMDQVVEPSDRKLRVLVGVAVSPGMWETVAMNLVKLRSSHAKDEFGLAIFHYTAPLGQVPSMPSDIEAILRPHIVHEEAGPGCKVEFWSRLSPDGVAAGFDYVWLMDGDLRLDFFNWDLYRHVLLDTGAVISQPSFVGWVAGMRGSGWGHLRMRGPGEDGSMLHWKHAHTIEQAAPMFSSKIWPAVHARAMNVDGRTDMAILRLYVTIGRMVQELNCVKAPVVVVNISPVRHADCRGLITRHSRCFNRLIKDDLYDITAAEATLLARGLGEPCIAAKELHWEGRPLPKARH